MTSKILVFLPRPKIFDYKSYDAVDLEFYFRSKRYTTMERRLKQRF
jgi:hypothetical protein